MTRSSKFLQFFHHAAEQFSNSNTLFIDETKGNRLFELSGESQAAAGSSKSPFAAQINGDGASIEILMHDAIGDSWAGLDSATLVKEIKSARGKAINLDINSFGGLAFDGIAIYNALAMHDAMVTATISGMAYSAASIIPLAADHIRIAENGDYGIHPAWIIGMGNQYEFTDIVDMLGTLDSQLIATYVARTGQTQQQITDWFIGKNNDGTMFSGPDAVKYGFADEMIPLKKKPSKSAETESKNVARDRLRTRIADISQKHAVALRRERVEQLRTQRVE